MTREWRIFIVTRAMVRCCVIIHDLIGRAVVDPNPEALERARIEWGISITASSIDQLPYGFNPEIVSITTKPNVRLSILKQLPNLAGAIIEKPLGTSLEDSIELANYCRDRGLLVNVNFSRRGEIASRKLCDGAFRELVGEIQTGTILYGNGLRNNGIHMIDLLRIYGLEIEAVQAINNIRPLGTKDYPNDGNITLVLTLDNGAKIFMDVLDFQYYRDVLIDLWGQKGRLEVFQEGLEVRYSKVVEHRAITGEMEVKTDDATSMETSCGLAYYEMYSNLADSIDGKANLFCPVEEALKAEVIVEAAFKSARQNGISVAV